MLQEESTGTQYIKASSTHHKSLYSNADGQHFTSRVRMELNLVPAKKNV